MASPAWTAMAHTAAIATAPATGGCGGGISAVKCQLTRKATDAVGKAVANASQSVMGQIADSLKNAANALLKGLMTFWLNIDTPAMGGGRPGAPTPLWSIQNNISWLVILIATVSLVIGGCQLVIRQKGQPVHAISMGLGRLVLVCAVGTWAVQELGQFSDTVSDALLRNAHIGDATWSRAINLETIVAAFAYKPAVDGLLMIFSLLVIIASLVQMLLMVLRVGLLIILTGILPLSAAAAINGEWSDTWKKTIGWLVAWLMYKPAAALLIASAFSLTEGKTLTETLSGLMLLLLSVLLLPALLRLIAPMTAALGASGGGQMAMAATAGLASGAVRLGIGSATGGAGAAATSGLGGSKPSGSSGVADAGMKTAEQAIGDGNPTGNQGSTGQGPQPTSSPGPGRTGGGKGPETGAGTGPPGSGTPPPAPPESAGSAPPAAPPGGPPPPGGWSTPPGPPGNRPANQPASNGMRPSGGGLW